METQRSKKMLPSPIIRTLIMMWDMAWMRAKKKPKINPNNQVKKSGLAELE
jgi:hypothetical protein